MKISRKTMLLSGTLLLFAAVGYALQSGTFSRSGKAKGRRVLYYQDSMHPWVKSDQPGKCTICAMDLTPIYEGEKGFREGDGLVVLSSNNVSVLTVQSEEVHRRVLSRSLRVAGTLEANETRKAILSAPASGRVLSLGIDYAGVEVHAKQPLVTILMADMFHKQTYIRAAHAYDSVSDSPGDSYSAVLYAPHAGTVLEKAVVAGQYVSEGERLLTMADPSVLWFQFDVYERELPWYEPGQEMEVTVEGLPDRKFRAVIAFIEPTLNPATRAVKVRADIRNPLVAANGRSRRLLQFGMYAEGRVRAGLEQVLAVPRSAVLWPGDAAFTYVDQGGGAFERRRVRLGRQGDEYWEILAGLDEGERVVTSGNVLIDAQAEFTRPLQEPSDGNDEFEITEAEEPATYAPAALHPETENGEIHASEKHVQRGEGATREAATKLELERVNPAKPPWSALPYPTSEVRRTSNLRGNRSAAAQRDAGPARARGAGNEVGNGSDEEPANGGAQMAPAGVAEADPHPGTPTNSTSPRQKQALQSFLAAAAEISKALAADDLKEFNEEVGKLGEVLGALQQEFAAPHRWGEAIKPLAQLKWSSAASLEEARKQFLPFSTATVELARRVKRETPELARLKFYHCPMAPKPGLWIQAKGPLANPFYGAEMLRCGKEVQP